MPEETPAASLGLKDLTEDATTTNGSSSRTLTTTHPSPNAINIPSNRSRAPVPPSPLSRIQSVPNPSSSQSSSSHAQTSPPNYSSKNNVPESSPCFIHSHLDRYGSLQDWLKNKGGPHHAPLHHSQSHTSGYGGQHRSGGTHLHNGPTPMRASAHPHRAPSFRAHHVTSQPHSPQHQQRQIVPPSPSLSPSASESRITSPNLGPTSFGSRGDRKEGSNGGYESDRSSQYGGGSTLLDGDLPDEDEEASSLTKQLAETAQGVREMSKELGRTRVRSKINNILIVTKARDNRLIKLTRELALYLMLKKPANPDQASRPGSNERGMVVYVDAQLRSSKRFDADGIQKEYPHLFEPVGRRRSSSTTSVNNLSAYPSTVSMSASVSEAGKRRDEGQLRYWTGEMCSNSPQLFDFVVTLGGDGTVLFTSWLFQRIVPPVLPFALGSLGFLTNFDFANYKATMDKVIDDGIRVNLRMRFTCTVYRAIAPEEASKAGGKVSRRKAIKKPGGEILMSEVGRSGWEALEGSSSQEKPCETGGKDKEIMCFSTRPVEQFEVLNDLVVDRGPSPFVSLLEVFGDEHHLTTVQADGLTVSTPTGSTAYSLSAGGSLVHPQIPAILITPICPHTLSFRPMLLPDSMELRICVPYNSRSTAWASFDGRGRVELKQGDHIKVTASKYPFPTVCADKASTDWFSSISRTLRWNEREKQKSFVVVEEDNEPRNVPKGVKASDHRKSAIDLGSKVEEEDENVKEEDDEEEEESFDIDDKSSGEATKPPSPKVNYTESRAPPLARFDPSFHEAGVTTPGRFVTPYDGPPPLSERHLVEALAAAELQSKDGEVGQRDNIRAGTEEMRVEGAHLIPPGRSSVLASPTDHGTEAPHEHRSQRHGGSTHTPTTQIPRARPPFTGRSVSDLSGQANRAGKRREEICRAKAFAFFGQDDSGSDMSDEASEA